MNKLTRDNFFQAVEKVTNWMIDQYEQQVRDQGEEAAYEDLAKGMIIAQDGAQMAQLFPVDMALNLIMQRACMTLLTVYLDCLDNDVIRIELPDVLSHDGKMPEFRQ